MRVGSLFAGIGGIDLGLERAGMTTVWQVEIDPFCRKVLERHFPHATRYEDVRHVGAHNLPPVDLIAGGFPCQDISQNASGWTRPGVSSGDRSGLWREFARVISETRPGFVVLENVEAIRYAGRGLDCVLGDLAALGYDAEWDVFPASSFGAPHKRPRLWLVAYPNGDGKPDRAEHDEASILPQLCGAIRGWPDPPQGLRVDDGLPARVDRIRSLGNAVVPDVAEWIGRRIMEVVR